jgi:hypothetical protein
MDPEKLFPELPEDVSALSRDELTSLIQQHESALASIATGTAFADADPHPSREEIVALAKAGAESLKTLRSLLDEMGEEDERFNNDLTSILTEAGVTVAAAEEVEEVEDEPNPDDADDEPKPEAEASEATAEVEAEVSVPAPAATEEAAVVASASPEMRQGYRFSGVPARPKKHEPVVEGANVIELRASAGIEGIGEGEVLDREGLAVATINKLRRFVSTPRGFSEKVVVASADWSDLYPEERKVYGDSVQADNEKLRAVRGPEALVAAGGWCAPSEIRYDIGALGTTQRPVRDALTAFNATRGGLRYFPDISIAATDVTGGITHLTEEQDEGGTFTKDCIVVECPVDSEVRADIIATCLQAGNLASIAFPELIAAWQDLLGVAAARTRDSLLLDAIKADPQTKLVTETAQAYGAYDGLVYNLVRMAAGYRNRHRLTDDAVLRSLAPAWLADLIVADFVARQFPVESLTRAGVAALIQRQTNVAVDWYLDSSADGEQYFAAQNDGADIVDFPDIAELYLWPEGGILFVDQGELNIGLVRDSILNETNDVRFFAETFENAAVIAAEAFVGRFTLCPSGTTAGPVTARAC